MFNYYVFNPSYYKVETQLIEQNLVSLNEIAINNRDEWDLFLFHNSFYEVQAQDGLIVEVIFSKLVDEQFSNTVLPRLLQTMTSIDSEIEDFKIFDDSYKLYNAFFGVNFSGVEEKERCIVDLESYKEFRDEKVRDVDANSFWERREQLFKNIIFCKEVKNNLHQIGGTYLSQIIKKIQELDTYIDKFWKEGDFSYKNANSNSALNISPESNTTMNNQTLKNMRMFSLPDGRRECFELHIKTGNLRFHIFPENLKVYIGYIGTHLQI
jgi:hypothetical protein